MNGEAVLSNAPGERIVIDDPGTALAAELRKRGPGKVLVCSGRNSADANGGIRFVAKAIEVANCEPVRFTEIEAEPVVATVEALIRRIREEKPVAVIAVGGGSAMDAAKAAYLAAQSGWKLADHFGVNRWSEACPGANPDRVICIPTTSGTGSEATPYSNIVDPALGVKKLISERFIVPELALLVPELTASMPESVTRATGCDALAHAIEGFLNVGADGNHPDANDWALRAIRLIVENLPAAIADGANAAARRNMAVAATLGGMVIRFKSTGLPHLASFSWFGKLEHGIAVAMLLPECWRYYLGNPAVAERTMQLAPVFPGATPEAVIVSYRRFLDGINVPATLRDCPGITPELLAATAKNGAQNKMKLENAPRPVPVEDSERILAEILEKTANGQPVIHLAGDSTVSDYPPEQFPMTGWGQALRDFCRPGIAVHNHASPGRSTKSFRDENRWRKLLDELRPGDFVLIQFGHNDQKADQPELYAEAETAYRTNLETYLREVRERKATPVLCTSVNRRRFNEAGEFYSTLGEYPRVAREVGRATGTAVIDLNAITEQWFRSEGPAGTVPYFTIVKPGEYPGYPDGVEDNSHFCRFGAEQIAREVVRCAREQGLPLADLFLNTK